MNLQKKYIKQTGTHKNQQEIEKQNKKTKRLTLTDLSGWISSNKFAICSRI